MALNKMNKFKPLYKKFAKLRENVQGRKKVLNFKKQKWAKFIEHYKKKLRWYKKFKLLSPNKYVVSKYPNRQSSYIRKYKTSLQSYKTFNLFYGGLCKKSTKKKIYQIKKKNSNNIYYSFLELFEQRLDIILYRAHFFNSVRSAQQCIVHGNVLVNSKTVKSKSYVVKTGDLISIDLKSFNLIHQNFLTTQFWPIPPKHLIINYKTLQIIVTEIKDQNFSMLFPIELNVEKILTNLSQN